MVPDISHSVPVPQLSDTVGVLRSYIEPESREQEQTCQEEGARHKLQDLFTAICQQPQK